MIGKRSVPIMTVRKVNPGADRRHWWDWLYNIA